MPETSVYKSKVDTWLAALLLVGSVLAVVVSVMRLYMDVPGAWLMVVLTLGVGAVLPLWLFLDTRYIIDSTHLRIRCGPFRWRIPIADITRISPSTSLVSGPALSLDRLRIEYGRGSAILISPRERARFIREIEALRR